MAGPKLTSLTQAERDEIAAWRLAHEKSLPAAVRSALEQHLALCVALQGNRHKLSQVLAELRRALGITASSERRTSKDPLGPTTNGDGAQPKSKRKRLELNVERYDTLSDWHKDLAKRHTKKAKAARRKLMKLPSDPEPEIDEESDEESAEEKAASAAEQRAHMARMKLGGGADPAFESSREAFITGAQVSTTERTEPIPAPEVAEEEGTVIDTRVDLRERFDFSFSVCRLTLEVEKKIVLGADGERRMVSASTASFGPPRYAVTWGLLAHMTVLVVQYAMPMNRLATLLSTDEKRFSSGSLSRMLRYVAGRFAPIYLTLVDSLADSDILSGDDTSCRVLEVSRTFAKASEPEPEPTPWHEYRDRDAARELLLRGDDGLAAMLAAELGFEFRQRTGDGPKKALHTTTVSGRSDTDDPRSLIVLYRSHLGGFGNLLEMLLAKRDARRSEVTIQSDLSSVNLVTDKELLSRFAFQYVGCASHARRPFALYEHEAPELCAAILHYFKGLAIYEHGLNVFGRNSENVNAVRGVDGRQMWGEIREVAEDLTKLWSRETKLGEGARYVLRHFDKLTAYLDNPRLEPSNNFSERMLRLEKLIESGSMFRASLEGRFALDIMRTVLQTAVAARAPLQDYLLAVLRASPEEVADDPARFTPREWAAENVPPPATE